jgi:hypothetical protein
MPIEVRELIIKATITQNENGGSSSGSGANDPKQNEELIKTCVEKVLEILKDKNGR